MKTLHSDNPRLLFVDDEPSVLNAMQRLFHEESYVILTASGGSEAIKLIQETGPVQIIVSDYRMPGMTGVELLQQAMLQWPDTRRIILSGYTDSDVLLAALNEGRVHHFLVKPWNNETLITVVKELLKEYEMLVSFRSGAEELARNNRIISRTNEHLSAILADVLANMRRDTAYADALMHAAECPSTSLERRHHDTLSPRECEILIAIASGQSPKSISMDLGLSIKTVSTYKKRLFEKMGFKNDAELIGYALKNNILPNSRL